MPTCFEVVSGQASQGDPAHIAKRALGAAPPGLDAAKRIKAVRAVAGKREFADPGRVLSFSLTLALAPQEASRAWPGPRRGQEEEMGSSEEEGDEGEAEGDPCPNCGRQYRSGEFWIQCDVCDRWFDGRCVGMSQVKAERQPEWRCPFCVKGA
ncbi:hypothetical protein H632_c591p0 [Helicosporidium sp. ATCC 50920]|nr:hypothetical protein H632_c591p0 [Helicosporidium sp. ATCC 50920]|eukprot:KDD75614.1 hypothetical protein H632_c591p0 [Helicosporidium sp. ATCC 50920]